MKTSNREMTSDRMHNQNCFAYLLQLKPLINPILLDLLPQLNAVHALNAEYQAPFAYGDLYTKTLYALEDYVEKAQTETDSQSAALNALIHSVYANDNRILENTEWLINRIGRLVTPQMNISAVIRQELADQNHTINYYSPQKADQLFGQLDSLFSPNFKPQFRTNLPSIKHYSYQQKSDTTEYRFGTQAQRHQGALRISPLFKRWLLINAQKGSADQAIQHIYFNNLGLDRSDLDIAGSKERAFTLALHELEKDPRLKTAVITLPAHKGLFSVSHCLLTDEEFAYDAVYKELLSMARGKKPSTGIADLWISKATKAKLFEPHCQNKVLKHLLTNSFAALAFHPGSLLSAAQKQAVWFHFIKYELTDYIINKLQPKGYNFTCKDAIDRGAVSSAYYNLMKSFALNNPLNKEEFERAIDAAATNVKARGMNFQRSIIWNTLDAYVNANFLALMADPKKTWLIYWRDMNCPHPRVEKLIDIRIKQCLEQLHSLDKDKDEIKLEGLKIILSVKKLLEHQVSGKRLLLEVVSRTSELLSNPSKQGFISYKNRAEALQINYGALYVIGGFMKAFVGVLTFIPSIGFSLPLIQQGVATAKSGFFAHDRNALCDDLIGFAARKSNVVA